MLHELRALSVARRDDLRADPLRFFTGGGDWEHAFWAIAFAPAASGVMSAVRRLPATTFCVIIASNALFISTGDVMSSWMTVGAPM